MFEEAFRRKIAIYGVKRKKGKKSERKSNAYGSWNALEDDKRNNFKD